MHATSTSRVSRANQVFAPSALLHVLVLICGVTHTRAVGNAVVSATLTLGDPGYRSKLLSNEQSVGAGVAEILSAVPHAIVDFTNVARGEGDAEIVVEASMIMGAPRVASSEEAETLITQHLEGNPLSKSVADLNKKLETTLGKPGGTVDYVQSIGPTSVTAKPYSDDAKDNGWGIGGAVIEGMVTMGSADYRTKLLAENRKAADSGFQQYINGIPGATTFGFVLNPSYENDNVIDFIAEVTIDDAKSNEAARDDTKFYLEVVGLDVATLSSIMGGIIEKPANGPDIVTDIEVTSIQAWAPANDPSGSMEDAGIAIFSVALRLGSGTYRDKFFDPDDKAAVEARIRAHINQVTTASVMRGGVSIFRGYESNVLLASAAIWVQNTTTNEQARRRVELYVQQPGDGNIDGLNAQFVDALGLPPIEGTPYVLGFEDMMVKAAKEDYAIDGKGKVTFYALITVSNREEREAILARAGETQQALATAVCESFVPMEAISAVNVKHGEATVSAASNDTVISAEITVVLGSAKSDKEAREKFRRLDLGEMSENAHDILVKELNRLQGGNALSSVNNLEITGVFTKQSYLETGEGDQSARVSAVLQDVGFDKNDLRDKSRAYCAFEESYAQDLEAIVRQGCGCDPLAEIVRVTFTTDNKEGRRLLGQTVTVETYVHGAVTQEVEAALKEQCAAGCMLGGSDAGGATISVKEWEESAAQVARMCGAGLALASILAHIIAVGCCY